MVGNTQLSELWGLGDSARTVATSSRARGDGRLLDVAVVQTSLWTLVMRILHQDQCEMRDVHIPKKALGKTTRQEATTKLRPLEVLVAVDSLFKDEKKQLRKMLQAEEGEATLVQDLLPGPEASGWMSGYPLEFPACFYGPPPMTASPWPSSTASWTSSRAHPAMEPQLPPRKDERGTDTATPVLKREFADFKQSCGSVPGMAGELLLRRQRQRPLRAKPSVLTTSRTCQGVQMPMLIGRGASGVMTKM